MEIQVPPFKEKRQFGRIKIPEPMLCQIYVPQSRNRRGYRGLIRNISLEGIYFVCDEKLPLAKDDIRHLILNVIYNYHKLYRLKFHALVARTEDKASQFAVALKFLSDPIYYPIDDFEATQLPFLDKTRILYRNYELYKKACDIIDKTPDIRMDKVNNIKKNIDTNLYEIEIKELVRRITDSFTGKFKSFADEFYRLILK